jgi:hypothetical protein
MVREVLWVPTCGGKPLCASATSSQTNCEQHHGDAADWRRNDGRRWPPFSVQGAPHGLAVGATRGFLFVATSGSNGLSAFSVNDQSEVLSPVPGSPFMTGQDVSGVAIVRT